GLPGRRAARLRRTGARPPGDTDAAAGAPLRRLLARHRTTRRLRHGERGVGATEAPTPTPHVIRPFHLAVYSDAAERGGAEMTLAQLIAGLPEQVRVTVVAIDDDVARFLAGERRGTRIELVEPIQSRGQLDRMWRHRRLFRRLRPDVIQFNL